jgi:hypothetical protein
MIVRTILQRFEERSWGVNLGILHPGGPGGGLAHARKKKTDNDLVGSAESVHSVA